MADDVSKGGDYPAFRQGILTACWPAAFVGAGKGRGREGLLSAELGRWGGKRVPAHAALTRGEGRQACLTPKEHAFLVKRENGSLHKGGGQGDRGAFLVPGEAC